MTPRKPSKRKLTQRQKELLKNLKDGQTVTRAALAAGYSPSQPTAGANQALKSIEKKAPELFAELSDAAFISKHIMPALNAVEVKVARVGRGTKRDPYRFIKSDPLVAWGPRVATNRLVAELKGLIVKERDTPATSIRVVVINAQNRPTIRGTPIEPESQ